MLQLSGCGAVILPVRSVTQKCSSGEQQVSSGSRQHLLQLVRVALQTQYDRHMGAFPEPTQPTQCELKLGTACELQGLQQAAGGCTAPAPNQS